MKITFTIAVLFFSMFPAFAQSDVRSHYPIADNEKTLLWEISGLGLQKPSFLFGTFHLMCKKDLRFSDNLKMALAASDVLLLELDMDDPKIAMGGLMLMGMKENKKLKELLTETDYKKVSSYFKDSLNLPLTWLENIQPLLLQSMLYTKLIPCEQMTSPEQELMKMVKLQHKSVEGLETIEFQASVFENIPYQVQAQLLVSSIDSIDVQRSSFNDMLQAYLEQDMTKLENIASHEPVMEKFEDALLNDRNKKWVNQLADSMSLKSYFIAVGAGHLPGKSGVIALLRKKGFSVRPIVNIN